MRNIQGSDNEIVEVYKYLGVHLNNKLDWTQNTDVSICLTTATIMSEFSPM